MRPLEGVRVLDLTTWLGAYTGRLLADLGAELIRVEPPQGSPERAVPPMIGHGVGAGFAFTEAGKRSVVLDLTSTSGADQLDRLLETAQLLLTSEGPAALANSGLHPDVTTAAHPRLVHVAISPYGLTGPYADRPASDLTLLAAGGLLALAGDPDREPVRAWGRQTAVITGVHAATAALIALLVAEGSGVGQVVDVSAQEAVAHSLENAVQYLDLEGVVRGRVGAGPAEAGTGLFECADGWVYLVGGLGGRPLAWDAIVDWLADSGIPDAVTLREPRWQQREFRRSATALETFRGLFEGFARGSIKRELYEDGQRRGISIAPVATPVDLLASPHLAARRYFRVLEVAGKPVTFPGPPYRFATDGTDVNVGPAAGPPALGADTESICCEATISRPHRIEVNV